MVRKKFTGRELERLVDEITETYKGDSGINFIDAHNLPVRGQILNILDLLFEVLFPGHAGIKVVTKSNIKYIVGDLLSRIHPALVEQAKRAYQYGCRIAKCGSCDCQAMAEKVTGEVLGELPRIRRLLKEDVHSAFDGDPAAKSCEEIVMSYPFVTAIATYRMAHELYVREVPLIPRIMSEGAHARTGIDIHPGARIGRNFFIDHGTGVVVGETTEIGNNVKVYQGVTLGALSFPTDEHGNLKRGFKRHPTIEDDVIIYANTTILGAVTIGKGSVVGGNVFLTRSVEPGSQVTREGPGHKVRQRDEEGQ